MTATEPAHANRVLVGTTSLVLSTARVNAPMTNPSWTARVSQATSDVERVHAAWSWGVTADAENQTVSTNS